MIKQTRKTPSTIRSETLASKRELLRAQRRWANARGLKVDARGYVGTVEANLLKPLSLQAREAFERGGGAELREYDARPAKMRALHSSAVLALNVFDHWVDRDSAPLVRTLALASGLRSLRFEAKFDTGLPGTPPHLDVALELDSGVVVGIESKFTEWLTPKRTSRARFKDKYFAGGTRRWAEYGLPKCQALAEGMMEDHEGFQFLDAAQLLKHALGLATQRGRRFALSYLFFDAACSAADVHRREAECFSALVGSELGFTALSYQAMLAVLRSQPTVDAEYLSYLGARYGL